MNNPVLISFNTVPGKQRQKKEKMQWTTCDALQLVFLLVFTVKQQEENQSLWAARSQLQGEEKVHQRTASRQHQYRGQKDEFVTCLHALCEWVRCVRCGVLVRDCCMGVCVTRCVSEWALYVCVSESCMYVCVCYMVCECFGMPAVKWTCKCVVGLEETGEREILAFVKRLSIFSLLCCFIELRHCAVSVAVVRGGGRNFSPGYIVGIKITDVHSTVIKMIDLHALLASKVWTCVHHHLQW